VTHCCETGIIDSASSRWNGYPEPTLIKIVNAEPHGDRASVIVTFSDGVWGEYDMGYLFERGGSMIEPLKERTFFERVFVETGALVWPNGFDLALEAIHRRLKEAGKLHAPAA